mmetsp:Transcript_16776/g.53653  ORF Transcript_16776/g.53653 Transcript_16776/m.53653 type:complete len:412 (-) Transcript_16776:69-1304(-)
MASNTKAYPVRAAVEYSVVLAHEQVAQDPQRTARGRHVQWHEPGLAVLGLLPVVIFVVVTLQHIVAWLERELARAAVQHNAQRGQAVVLFAIRIHVCILQQLTQRVRGTRDQRSSSIEHDLAPSVIAQIVTEVHPLAVHGHVCQSQLPVKLLHHRHPSDVASVERRIRPPEEERRLLHGQFGEVEREHGPLEQALAHDVVEHGREVVRGQGGEGEAQNAREAARVEHVPILHRDLAKVLPLDLERAQRECVLADEPVNVARAELDLHVVADLVERGRARVVIAGMLGAGIALTQTRSHPQIAGASIEDDIQELRRRPDAHLADVLGIFDVVEAHRNQVLRLIAPLRRAPRTALVHLQEGGEPLPQRVSSLEHLMRSMKSLEKCTLVVRESLLGHQRDSMHGRRCQHAGNEK